MLLNSEMLNELNKIILLKNEELQKDILDIHSSMMRILDDGITNIKKDLHKKITIKFEEFGEHIINTFNQHISPLSYFVLIKANKAFTKNYLVFQNKNLFKNKIIEKSNTEKTDFLDNVEFSNLLYNYLKENMEEGVRIYQKYGTIMINYKNLPIKIVSAYLYEDNTCDYFDNGTLTTINIYKAKNNIDKIIKDTKYNFCDICRLLKTFELEMLLANKSNRYYALNTLFVETVIYNIPKNLIVADDIFDAYVKCMNYLDIANLSNFKYLDNTPITDQLYLKNIKNYIGKMKYFMLNAIEIIEKEAENSNQMPIDDTTMKGKIKKKIDDILN